MAVVKEATNGTQVKGPHADYPYDVHTMVRTLGTDSGPNVQTVDMHIQAWLDSGFELFATHYTGEAKDQGARMVYVLRRVRA